MISLYPVYGLNLTIEATDFSDCTDEIQIQITSIIPHTNPLSNVLLSKNKALYFQQINELQIVLMQAK